MCVGVHVYLQRHDGGAGDFDPQVHDYSLCVGVHVYLRRHDCGTGDFDAQVHDYSLCVSVCMCILFVSGLGHIVVVVVLFMINN